MATDTETGRVWLVGAGPGDPGLITLRGIEALQVADAVVYDYLASPDLLHYVRQGAELHYVGKKSGQHTLRQDGINQLLVELGRAGKRVVRLKGGDPFVFGRGGEEAEALADAGVPFEVVPGVTSAISVPAYAGIPVTHRGLSSSLTVITGHEDPTKPDSALDWEALARMDTLVVLMGVANLPGIVEALLACDKPAGTPTAVIQWGTFGSQRTVTGTLRDIVSRVEAAGLEAPAITVIGDVVRMRERLDWFECRPLHGMRVLVTRTREQAGRLSAGLRAVGAEPVECPLIETVPPIDWAPVDAAIAQLPSYQWIVFTSANGVDSFWQRLSAAGQDARALAGTHLAAIGPATAEALHTHGLRADLVPPEYIAESIADAMGDVRGQRILLPRAEKARQALTARLRAAGAEVDEVTAYRTVKPAGLAERLHDTLAQADVITFTSSSTVQHFFEALGPDGCLPAGVTVACIGPITAQTAREHGLQPEVLAQEYTIDGLIAALLVWRNSSQRNGDKR